MSMSGLLLLLGLLMAKTNATLLTKSHIETCDTDGLNRNSCENKLVILYSVKNGQVSFDAYI